MGVADRPRPGVAPSAAGHLVERAGGLGGSSTAPPFRLIFAGPKVGKGTRRRRLGERRWRNICTRPLRPSKFDCLRRTAAVPEFSKAAFLSALIKASDADIARELTRWLRDGDRYDASVLLPLGIPAALEAIRERNDSRALRDIFGQAFTNERARAAVFDAVVAETVGDAETIGKSATALSRELSRVTCGVAAQIVERALRLPKSGVDWLGPYFFQRFSAHDAPESWNTLFEKIPEDLCSALISTMLAVASDSRLPDEVFRWVVEERLMSIPEDSRPHDPSWAAPVRRPMCVGPRLAQETVHQRIAQAWPEALAHPGRSAGRTFRGAARPPRRVRSIRAGTEVGRSARVDNVNDSQGLGRGTSGRFSTRSSRIWSVTTNKHLTSRWTWLEMPGPARSSRGHSG